MKYLAVTNWRRYQHYSDRNPPWIKFYVELADPRNKLNELPVSTRYLFDRLLLLAALYANAIPNDPELVAKLLGMSRRDCRDGIAQLLKGRWIKEKSTRRSASKPDSKMLDPESREQRAEEQEQKQVLTLVVDAPAANGNLDFEKSLELTRIIGELSGVDPMTRERMEPLAMKVPVAVLASLRVRCAGKSPGWVVRALQSEIKATIGGA